jgi:hypothetical protein
MHRSVLALLTLLVVAPPAYAATPPAPPKDAAALLAPPKALAIDPAADRLVARGGEFSLRWNDDLLRDLGLARRGGEGRNEASYSVPLSKDAFLEADLSGRALLPFAAGRGELLGGFAFVLRDGKSLAWRNPRFVVRPGTALRLDFVSDDGAGLFYADNLMYAVSGDGRALELRSADLRVAPALAERLGHAEYAGIAIAELQGRLPLVARLGAAQPKACGNPNWPGKPVPGVPGAVYQADVFMTTFSGQVMRCRASAAGGACDGPGGATDGQVVIAPSSTLRNNVNNGSAVPTVPGDPLGTSSALYTADVEWETKFNNQIAGPYAQTDQHPYLIWNLYRIEAGGGITQIGRSGVKHAFLTTNSGCAAGENCSSYILGRQCGDTYSTSNNDSNSSLGPRRELVPALGQWGRCRSIYDLNCDGVQNSSGNGLYDQRMIVAESDLDPALHPGASWMFESWYIVRDDIDIYNTMASLPVSVNWNGSTWVVSNGTPFRLGSAVDRWAAAAPAGTLGRVDALASPEGHAKLGLRVTDLGNGTWRYEYALMNFDFARAVTSGAEPNMEVLRNHGFDAVLLPLGSGVTITDLVIADGDRDAGNDWTASVDGDVLAVRAPQPSASLDWGTMLRIGFVADAPPEAASATLEVTEAGSPPAHAIATLGPVTPGLVFANGFE